jgi:hypothetical protein
MFEKSEKRKKQQTTRRKRMLTRIQKIEKDKKLPIWMKSMAGEYARELS